MSGRRVGFGVAGLCAQSPSGTREEVHRELHQIVAVGRIAEEEGLDSLWLSEHHFSTDCYLPAIMPMLAALAQETERVKLSTNVALAPMYHPLRLAEDCAVIDHLAGGRLMLGLGLGYREEEFAGLGVDRRRRGALTEEVLTTLKAAWDGKPVQAGPDSRSVVVTPPPFQAGGPPLLLGALAEVGVRRARRLGDGWIAPLLSEVRHAEKRLRWLLDEGNGDLDGFHIGLTFNAFVAASDAWAKVRPGALHAERQYRSWLQAAGDIKSLENKPLDTGGEPDGAPAHFVCGTPEEVTARLQPWYDYLLTLPEGVIPHITIRLTWPSVDEAANAESVRLFAREVVPALRDGSR